MEEAWNQAAQTTGINEVDAGLGYGFGAFLLAFEIVWWIAIAMIAKNRMTRRRTEISPDSDAYGFRG